MRLSQMRTALAPHEAEGRLRKLLVLVRKEADSNPAQRAMLDQLNNLLVKSLQSLNHLIDDWQAVMTGYRYSGNNLSVELQKAVLHVHDVMPR